MFFNYDKLPWWAYIARAIAILLVVGLLFYFWNHIEILQYDNPSGYKNKLAQTFIYVFVNYGGRWVLAAAAVYYAFVDIREGIKLQRLKK